MKEFWNERYASAEYAYGKAPNEFFKSCLDKQTPIGKILLPGEGEGRNAVYAAQKGLDVFAYDFSEEGKRKAQALAEAAGVSIHYDVCDFSQAQIAQNSYDTAALIYAHFPADILDACYEKVAKALKPGGILILEGYAKTNLPLKQANPKIGGPGDVRMLFTVEQITDLFKEIEPLQAEETEIYLKEGLYHEGRGRVIRFEGRKRG